VQVLAADGKTPLLRSDRTDSVLRLDVEPDGTTRARSAGAAAVASALGRADVANAPIDAMFVPFSVQEGQGFSGPVASVTNGNPLETAAELSAIIDWGDGSAPTAGVISGAAGHFTVTGSHTFVTAGRYPVHVDVTDADGATVRAQTSAAGNRI